MPGASQTNAAATAALSTEAFAALFWGHDWAASALGDPAGWSTPLRTLVDVMLGSNQPMFIAWGAERTLLYNRNYAVILAARHPAALGRPFLSVWSEVRDELVPIVDQVMSGQPVQMDDISLMLNRRGEPEEAHFAFSYTPVRDDAGRVAGFFCPCLETTGERLADRRLRASEAEARGVLDGMGEGFVLIDRAFRVQRINREGLRIDGRPESAIIGRHLLQIWPEAEHLPTWPMFKRAMAERVAAEVVYRHVGSGHDVWLSVRAFPSGDGLAVFYGDVSAAKRAEQAMRESEAQFRGLAQAVPNQAWIAQPDGDLMWFNQQVFAYSGLDYPALVGSGWQQIVHPDDLGAAGAAWGHSLATGEPYQVEFRIRRADGCFRWFLVRAQPIRGDDGAVLQWAGTNTDIQQQKTATQALAELNAALEQRVVERTAERDRVWRNSRDLLAVFGADGVCRAANPAWATTLGHMPDEMVGRRLTDCVWPDDRPATEAAFAEAMAQRDLSGFENRLRHADGSPVWIAWQSSAEGGVLFAYGRNVTAEKAQAATLQKVEEQLRQAQKMEAVGQLTGGLAHDFNNLLAGISGSLELMQMRLARGRVTDLERYVTSAQGAARRAAVLTHRLLAFSRQQTLEPRPTDLNRLVAGMEELIRRTVGPEILVEVMAGPDLWRTLVDANQLENALLNLCINGRDAMPGGGRLVIETGNCVLEGQAADGRELPPGHYVALRVTDNGTGMTPAVIARAFDPFFTTKPLGQGTGLGLSMIYGFVRQSGGTARIHSEVGAGTTIGLYLPRYDGDEPVAETAHEPAAAPRAGHGETVLVVDDEPSLRLLVSQVLQDLGYLTIEAADGAAALRVVRSDARIDLLVTDVGLPGGMNGRQVAHNAQALRPGLKVLFITGYADNAVLSHGHLLPGMQILTKPFALDTLAGRVRQMIGSDEPASA